MSFLPHLYHNHEITTLQSPVWYLISWLSSTENDIIFFLMHPQNRFWIWFLNGSWIRIFNLEIVVGWWIDCKEIDMVHKCDIQNFAEIIKNKNGFTVSANKSLFWWQFKLSTGHSPEISCFCLMKWPGETFQNLLYFM